MKKLWLIVPLFSAVGAVWLVYPMLLPWLQGRQVPVEGAGLFGDSYGALNTLFSGLAFAGIIISILLQSEELKETREELRGQKEQMSGQREQLERQTFENTFFQMLRLHSDIVDSFSYSSSILGRDLRGRQCLFGLKNDLAGLAGTWNAQGKTSDEAYLEFYRQVHSILGHYFRNLYHLIKYVHNAPVPDKKFYTNIVRAQLSSEELYLLFYNALSLYGKEKLKPLIEKYELLEHLPTSGINVTDAQRFNIVAFGNDQDWRETLGVKGLAATPSSQGN